MRYIRHYTTMFVNNHTVSFTDEGPEDTMPVILIHGFPLNKSMWNKQVEELNGVARVIAYDIRGHGNSEVGHGDFSIELFASDLIALMDMLKIDRAVLCGFSMGGYIALNAAINHPERCIALVLCDTSCKADTSSAKAKRMKAIAEIRESGTEKYADESILSLFAPTSITAMADMVALVRGVIANTNTLTLTNTLAALTMREETCSKLNTINVPTLIIVGSEDNVTPPAIAQYMHSKIDGSQLCIIEHAGHLSNLENPAQFNGLLIKFIVSVYTKPSIGESKGSIPLSD